MVFKNFNLWICKSYDNYYIKNRIFCNRFMQELIIILKYQIFSQFYLQLQNGLKTKKNSYLFQKKIL